MFKPSNKKLLIVMLLVGTLLATAACGDKPTSDPKPEPPQVVGTVAERLANQDFTKMAEDKTEFLGDASRVGTILGLSLLAPYNTTGMELETNNQPYKIKVTYSIPKEDPNNYSEDEIATMASMTAMNCFVLVTNLDEVEMNLNYYLQGEDTPKNNMTTYKRATFDEMCGVDVRTLADNPQLWATAVEAYAKEHLPQK